MNKKLCLTAAATALAGCLAASGAGAVGVVSVTPSPVNVRAPQETPKNVAITVTNGTGASISFGASTISGPDAGEVMVRTDGCANHTIPAGRTCHVYMVVTATGSVGSVETATVSINDSLGNTLVTDNVNATVIAGALKVTKVGRTVTIKNGTANSVSMDYSTFGNLEVTGGSCTDYIGAHTTCTLLVTLTPPDAGDELEVLLNAGHGNQYYDLFF